MIRVPESTAYWAIEIGAKSPDTRAVALTNYTSLKQTPLF